MHRIRVIDLITVRKCVRQVLLHELNAKAHLCVCETECRHLLSSNPLRSKHFDITGFVINWVGISRSVSILTDALRTFVLTTRRDTNFFLNFVNLFVYNNRRVVDCFLRVILVVIKLLHSNYDKMPAYPKNLIELPAGKLAKQLKSFMTSYSAQKICKVFL